TTRQRVRQAPHTRRRRTITVGSHHFIGKRDEKFEATGLDEQTEQPRARGRTALVTRKKVVGVVSGKPRGYGMPPVDVGGCSHPSRVRRVCRENAGDSLNA